MAELIEILNSIHDDEIDVLAKRFNNLLANKNLIETQMFIFGGMGKEYLTLHQRYESVIAEQKALSEKLKLRMEAVSLERWEQILHPQQIIDKSVL